MLLNEHIPNDTQRYGVSANMKDDNRMEIFTNGMVNMSKPLKTSGQWSRRQNTIPILCSTIKFQWIACCLCGLMCKCDCECLCVCVCALERDWINLNTPLNWNVFNLLKLVVNPLRAFNSVCQRNFHTAAGCNWVCWAFSLSIDTNPLVFAFARFFL